MLEMNIIKNKSEFIVGDIQISTFEQDHNYMTSLGIAFGTGSLESASSAIS